MRRKIDELARQSKREPPLSADGGGSERFGANG
jgi:hypothetical protein